MSRSTPKIELENRLMNTSRLWAVCLCLALIAPAYAQDDDHDDHTEDESGVVEMTVTERASAGVVVDTVAPRAIGGTVRVPGEVIINAYRSVRVTPRVTAQVDARHVKLGDHVESGQRLLTLSSVQMAEAQGALTVADREWQRVRLLGRDTVSARRYTEAQVAQQQALAKVLAYGMTERQATALMRSGDASKATGAFDLLAPQAGTVLRDEFIVGELIEPGRVLFDISDESVLWVEASTVPSDLTDFEIGAPARIAHDDDHWINGTVVQRHHQLDETTRRQGVRIEVENTDDHLHPGQFVEVEISTGEGPTVLAIPSGAITLIKGVPTVFQLENGNEFHPQAVETGMSGGGWTEIRQGLDDGDTLAITGVFHIKSLLLKSSLGEGHAH